MDLDHSGEVYFAHYSFKYKFQKMSTDDLVWNNLDVEHSLI